ncbi:MAG: sulfatase-like hydrolase/transferase [Armatimonadetes bacterium]|nr:sulfatase-like hydrolase/transferase [Armatimonadota bacterium]MDE2206223.1 sulfatase-like hydrolase/transferase [Armatimonadota bacterium]
MPKRPPNILMIVIDSLRADHCSTYGYPRSTTPFAAQLARRGVQFNNHFSAYIPTTPAYTTIFTGRDVMAHEIVSLSPKGPIDAAIPTLPELLAEHAGYKSVRVGFGGDFFRGFTSTTGYDEGWLAWSDGPARKAENLNNAAIPELERLAAGSEPWLLFMRHMDPHAPYLPPAPFDRAFYTRDPADPNLPDTMSPVRDFPNFADFHLSWMPPGIRDINHPIAMYDGAVAYMDACIQAILNRLDDLGQRENTLIIWSADHGETLADHGCYFDHHGLYEPTLHVPLILSHPGQLPQGTTVDGITLHEDMLPTILDYVGLHDLLESLPMEGRSMLPLARDGANSHRSEFYLTECTWMRKRGWRTPEWKLIEACEPDFHHKPPVELYNLVTDPEEAVNLVEQEPELTACLQKRMHRWVDERVQKTGKPDPILQYELGLDRRIGSIATAQKLQDR